MGCRGTAVRAGGCERPTEYSRMKSMTIGTQGKKLLHLLIVDWIAQESEGQLRRIDRPLGEVTKPVLKRMRKLTRQSRRKHRVRATALER